MARSVQDPEHKALRILATLFTWAFVQEDLHRNGVVAGVLLRRDQVLDIRKEINRARNSSLWPQGGALRGAPRPDDRRADRRPHQIAPHLRVWLGPLALPRHRADRRADPDGP